MKIRTRVKIAGGLVLAMLLIYGAVVLRLDRTMNALVQQARETNEFANKISMLRNLTQDYLLYRTERAQKQWTTVYAEVLAAIEQPHHRMLEGDDLKDVSQKLRTVGDIFDRLMSSQPPATVNKMAASENIELQNRLTTQLLLITQDLLTRYFILADRVNEKLIVTQRLISVLDILALLILTLLLISNAVFLRRAVVRPVLRLHEGAEIIGAGNLNHRVALDSGDEIGDLARAFNRMTASLQKVTVSRNELVREMAERRRVEEALKDSETRLRLAQDAAKAGTWEWDLGTNRNFWSPELWPLYGLEPFCCEPCYDSWLQTVHPDDREVVAHAVQEAARQGKELNAKWRVRDPDGSERWLMARGQPRGDGSGPPTGYIGIVLDITELKRVEAAWRESEERLRLLGDNLPESAVYQYTHGSDGKVRFLHMSAGIEKLNGVKVQEVLADAGALHRQILPEYYDRLVAAEVHSARELADFDMEVPMRRPDGQVRWMHLHSRPRRLPDGLIVWDGVQTDVTARRQAEAALRESEERYRLLHETLRDAFVRVAMDGRVVECNDIFCRMLGYAPEEIYRLTYQQLTPARWHALETDLVREQIIPLGYSEVYEKEYQRQDGTIFPVELRTILSRDAAGQPTAMWAIVRDITERKQAEAALRESEAKYRNLFENMAEEVHFWQLVRDASGAIKTWRLVDANPPTLKTWGRARLDEIKGKTPDEIFGPGATDHYLPVVQKIMTEGVPYSFEDYFPTLDKYFRFSSVPLGEYFITTGADITSIKKAEAALQERSAELQQAVTDLEAANAEMERFTYTISHDLKSPLVTISTFLKYLEEDLRQGDAVRIDKDLHFMRTAADKMGQLLHELLEMSRIGRMVNPTVEVGFQELAQEVLQAVAGAIAERGVAVDTGSEDVTLFGDRPRLLEVWQNLVENGIKYIGKQAEPRLTLGHEQQGDDTVFFVCDNGMGIEPKYQDKVFGLFEKLDARTRGSGIGLAIVKRIVELYQGRIWVESAGAGQGACFYFTLPAALRKEDK
jgi:PAS domain S-box-containing protein